ncbi:hypothetical protein [Thioalkalivibrio thiocyanoxidans]|uniref:hypothetical protein n=1 Tax=Thioalkalivibrio thiocyanoxidans TaxID=152475 RepID=UPI000365A51F|nr:hypothetical protein [Thioalkalivibrio thiocyanoxidans]
MGKTFIGAAALAFVLAGCDWADQRQYESYIDLCQDRVEESARHIPQFAEVDIGRLEPGEDGSYHLVEISGTVQLENSFGAKTWYHYQCLVIGHGSQVSTRGLMLEEFTLTEGRR